MQNQSKKKFKYIIIVSVFLVLLILGTNNSNSNDISSTNSESQSEIKKTDNKIDDTSSELETQTEKLATEIQFSVSKVQNDTTGNWRVSVISESIQPETYALDYYKKYFKNDDEIHGIINFNYNTTTKLSVLGNLLNITVYEYVPKEEHDAKLLFSGQLLDQWFVDIDSGEITTFDS